MNLEINQSLLSGRRRA